MFKLNEEIEPVIGELCICEITFFITKQKHQKPRYSGLLRLE